MLNWYNLFNLTEFEGTELVSKEIDVNLVGIGQKTILVTKGFSVGITYDDVFLTLGLGNPFPFGNHSVYVDANQNVWLGVPVA